MLSKERWTAAVFIVSIAALIPRAVEGMDRSNGDVIVEFDQLLQTNITGPPVGQLRSYAMLHIAMADAVVAIEGQYAPFHAQVSAPSGASAEAAAA
jgi:hypothetical protein